MSPKMEVHVKRQVYKMVMHEVVIEDLESKAASVIHGSLAGGQQHFVGA